MISEKSINQSLDLIHPDLLLYLSTFSPENLSENCSDFVLPLDVVGFPQSVDQHSQVMYEGEKVTSPECSISDNETVKAQLEESECGPLVVSREVPLLSRQSSLIEEWFGNINNTHPNDISVDSSLEALFANTEWQDFKVEMPADDAAVTENCLVDPSVYQTVNYPSPDIIPAEETVTSKSLPLFSAVVKSDLQPDVVHENVGELSPQCMEGTFHTYTPFLPRDAHSASAVLLS